MSEKGIARLFERQRRYSASPAVRKEIEMFQRNFFAAKEDICINLEQGGGGSSTLNRGATLELRL